MRNLMIALASLILPAIGTVLVVAIIQATTSYVPVVQGHAVPQVSAECTTSPDEMFNDCATLDTTQVIDTRAVYGEVTCPAGVTPGTPEGWARCDITEHQADGPAADTELDVK